MYNDASSYKKSGIVHIQCNLIRAEIVGYSTRIVQASIEWITLTSPGAASSRCNKDEVAGEIGSTWLLAGGSCNNLPHIDYSTFELFSEGAMVKVADRPERLGVLEGHGKVRVANNKSHGELI